MKLYPKYRNIFFNDDTFISKVVFIDASPVMSSVFEYMERFLNVEVKEGEQYDVLAGLKNTLAPSTYTWVEFYDKDTSVENIYIVEQYRVPDTITDEEFAKWKEGNIPEGAKYMANVNYFNNTINKDSISKFATYILFYTAEGDLLHNKVIIADYAPEIDKLFGKDKGAGEVSSIVGTFAYTLLVILNFLHTAKVFRTLPHKKDKGQYPPFITLNSFDFEDFEKVSLSKVWEKVGYDGDKNPVEFFSTSISQ
jgi:hypothetical protein